MVTLCSCCKQSPSHWMSPIRNRTSWASHKLQLSKRCPTMAPYLRAYPLGPAPAWQCAVAAPPAHLLCCKLQLWPGATPSWALHGLWSPSGYICCCTVAAVGDLLRVMPVGHGAMLLHWRPLLARGMYGSVPEVLPALLHWPGICRVASLSYSPSCWCLVVFPFATVVLQDQTQCCSWLGSV